jgi:hypothetical protein
MLRCKPGGHIQLPRRTGGLPTSRCRLGRASPIAPAGAIAATDEPGSPRPAVPSVCPCNGAGRSLTVNNGSSVITLTWLFIHQCSPTKLDAPFPRDCWGHAGATPKPRMTRSHRTAAVIIGPPMCAAQRAHSHPAQVAEPLPGSLTGNGSMVTTRRGSLIPGQDAWIGLTSC